MPIVSIFAIAVLLLSCGKDENIVFDTPFIAVEPLNTSSGGPISSEQEFVAEYMLYLNAAAPKKNVDVSYDIIVGDGLKEGVDFELITKETTQTFLQGIYDLSIRIKWLKTCVRDAEGKIIEDSLDTTKDVSIKIVLKSNSENYDLGYPGPAQKFKQVVILKERAK